MTVELQPTIIFFTTPSMFLIDENHKMTTTGGKPEKYKGTEGKILLLFAKMTILANSNNTKEQTYRRCHQIKHSRHCPW